MPTTVYAHATEQSTTASFEDLQRFVTALGEHCTMILARLAAEIETTEVLDALEAEVASMNAETFPVPFYAGAGYAPAVVTNHLVDVRARAESIFEQLLAAPALQAFLRQKFPGGHRPGTSSEARQYAIVPTSRPDLIPAL